MTYEEYLNAKTGRLSIGEFVKRKSPKDYEKILKCSGSNFKEQAYCYFNHIDVMPFCPICGKEVGFHGNRYGFAKYCSPQCRAKDPDVEQKRKNTLLDKYGENATKLIHEKVKKTQLEKYGVDNIMKLKSVKERQKQTVKERYGVDNPMKSDIIKQRSKDTCLEKYGSEYFLSSQQHKDQQKEVQEKIRQTCLKKYGVKRATQNDEVKQKITQTVKERYGVNWACMRDEIYEKNRDNSVPNLEFATLLQSNSIAFESEFTLDKYVYDFKIDNTLVEIDPAATHNSTWSPYKTRHIQNDYHLSKTNVAKDNQYRCIHVWDWDDLQKIIYILKSDRVIYARKCIIKEVSKKDADTFLNAYHLQDTCKGQTVRLGLYYEGELVEIMTFGKPRYNKKYEYELLRLCSGKNKVIGGSEKLFAFFVTNYNPSSVISYCDNSKFNGDVYLKLGFNELKKPQSSLHWYHLRQKQHITNNLLIHRGFDQLFNTDYGKGTSNEELMLQHGFVKIYDAGQSTFIWQKEYDK